MSVSIQVMEHHSNLVPWQLVAQRTGATLKVRASSCLDHIINLEAAFTGLKPRKLHVSHLGFCLPLAPCFSPVETR